MAADTRYITHTKWSSYSPYPSGRQVASTYDALYRRKNVTETAGGSPVAS